MREQEELEELLLRDYGCIVLFLDPVLQKKYYHGFCREYLAPIMHNQMHVTQDRDPFQKDEWRAYCSVSKLFADKVMEMYSGVEMIWVHDYHLLMVPSFIVRKIHLVKIGFFMHAPFPSSDIWRTVAVRLELLRSLLNVDLVGFLMFEYTRNFLTCCKRMLALEYEYQKGGFLGIEYEGRHVILQVATFGISPSKVESRLLAMASGKTKVLGSDAIEAACRRAKRVVSAVDYLDRLKGVAPKLLAWEELLTEYQHYRNGYVLVQVCVGARNRIQIQTAPAVEQEIRTIVDRINEAFPGAVHFEVRDQFGPDERLRLWCNSDALLTTSLREAINTTPLEFVLARHLAKRPAGVCVLSEFTGFARVLCGTLRVNPNSQTELVETLDLALNMSPDERQARAARDVAHIMRCTLEAFAARFLTELKATATKRAEDFVCVGFSLSKFRLIGMGANFKPLDNTETIDAFQRAKRRAIMLDWGGTLAPAADGSFFDKRDTAGYALPRNVLDALATLCADPSCHVMILSGLPKEKVLAAFGGVPNLSLAVEHGFKYRVGNGKWQTLGEGDDDYVGWRSVAQSVMSVYATRTHGAIVQEKGSSILWNYAESDPEFGYMQGKELQTTLQHVLADFPVAVRTGKGYVEACLKGVNKGSMAERFVDVLEADGAGALDFVLCAGDDSTDELMFASLNTKLGKENAKLFTVTIGRKPSEARHYLDGHSEVVALLEKIATLGFAAPGNALGGMGAKSGGMGMGAKMSASTTNLAALG
uniref:Alpha,alpha-trehalose-phosphate synthase (UDP-forming) n=1 Tax=Coccolithus braarudii TaxID=221442 RepID=A0A7S0Q8K7_9EUKA